MDSFHLATLIRRLHLQMRAHILEELHSQGFGDITQSQLYVFQSPGPDGARPTELARRARMTKQAMNHILAALEAGGYLDRVPSDDDARGRVVRLTPKGKRVTRLGQNAGAALQREWTELVGPDRMSDVLDTLGELDASSNIDRLASPAS